MKKIFNLFVLFILLVVPISIVYCDNTEEVVTSIGESENYLNDFSTKLNNWINNNKDAANYIIDNELIEDFSYGNFNSNLSYLISSIESNYPSSSSSLNSIKNDLVYDLTKLNEIKKKTYDYLLENKEYEIVGNLEVFNEIKNVMENVKPNIKSLCTTIYNTYYNYLNNKIDSKVSLTYYLDRAENLVSTVESMTLLVNDLVNWQDLYNAYYDEDYYNYIKKYFDEIKNKLSNGYDELLEKGYNYYKGLLDDKITIIEDAVNREDDDSILNHNNKLNDIIESLNNYKTRTSNIISSISKNIKISSISSAISTKKTTTLKKYDLEIEYVESLLIDSYLIKLLKEADSDIITIDHDNKLIIYNNDVVAESSFTNKFITSYTGIVSSGIYNKNVGTLSKLSVMYNKTKKAEYTVVVKGDVYPDGNINSLDYVKIKNHIMEDDIITSNVLLIAGDYYVDNKITSLDYVKIKNYIMGA